MELVPKLSKKVAIFLGLILLTSLFILLPWEQNRGKLCFARFEPGTTDKYKDKIPSLGIEIKPSIGKFLPAGSSSQYIVGDELRIGIKLVDGCNTVRIKGGDQLRVRIFEDRKNASASGYLIDHQNGTYTAVVRALWSGYPKIVVYSAYPRELVRSWYYTYSQIPATRVYYAHYKRTTAIGFCHPILDIVSKGNEPFCNRTNHNGGMSLYCSKPGSVTCNDLVRHSFKIDKNPKIRTQAERELLGRNMETILPFLQINVKGPPTISEDNLPKCAEYSKKDLWMKNSPVGFFYSNSWRSLHCKSLSSLSIDKCIRGMHFTLIGDSTTRQWFEHFESDYSCAVIKSKSRQGYKFCASSRHNFTAEWAIHSIPGNIYLSEPPQSISGMMAEYTYTKSHIFLFRMQVHVSAYHPSVFRDRMTHIRNTIHKVLDTNQNARFFVKGPHTFKDQGQYGDYFGYVYRVIMLDIFQDLYDKITYLDSKDMTIATYQTDFHPNKCVVRAMVQQFLSYVCD